VCEINTSVHDQFPPKVRVPIFSCVTCTEEGAWIGAHCCVGS